MGPDVDVAVVGSVNLDLSVRAADLPRPGQTVMGGDALWSPGGKGANQAVAAARLGRSVALVGCVGDDAAGRDLLAALADAAVDTRAVGVLTGVPSGVASIAVSTEGENLIVVSPGANGRVSAEHVVDALDRLSPRVVLAQFEIPPEAVAAIVGRAKLLVVNPAPARPLAPAVLAAVDVLIPNRGELAQLVGAEPAVNSAEVVDQARSLGIARVVVTMSGEGALVLDETAPAPVTTVPALPVAVVDSTAAGDSFSGGLVDALLDGADLVAAARWATRVAALTVSRRGAQISLPTRAEVTGA